MGTGYVRNDTANNIADGNIINASDLDGEFDAVQSAFDASTGHTHDGTVGEGAPIETIGPTQDVVATASVLRPKTDNTVDLGTTTLEYKDLFLDGTAHIDTLDVDENASITGTLGVTGTTTLGTANITTGTITTADINGGNIDGTIIGATTAAAITGTTITGTSFVTSGDMTFGDNDKAIFGAGSDLQIYHDGSNSYIVDNGTGDLHLSAANFYITNPANTENHLSAINNGAVTLYYDNSTKLATTSTGVDITGTLTSDGLEIDGKVLINAPADTLAQEIRGRSSDDVGYLQFSNNAGTTSSYIGSNGSYLNFEVGSAERMRIANNGDISFYEDTGTTAKFFWDASAESLGIGTSTTTGFDSGADDLIVGSGSASTGITIYSGTTGYGSLHFADANSSPANYVGYVNYNHGTNSMQFATASTEAMRIDSSGNLLVGTTDDNVSDNSGASNGGINIGTAGVKGVISAAAAQTVAYLNRLDSDGDIAVFRKDGAPVGSISSVLNGSDRNLDIGSGDTRLLFYGPTTPAYVPRKASNSTSDGYADLGLSSNRFKDLYLSGGVYGNANALKFSTDAGTTQHMTLDTSGNLLVGTTSDTGGRVNITRNGIVLRLNTANTSNTAVQFVYNGNTQVGGITTTTTSTAYNTSSDHRLKENVVELTDATTRLKQLEPKRFNFIADADTTVDGFLAHEVQTVVPEAITGTHNEVDADGNPVYQGIDQSKLVPLLVATIKELEARITALEAN
jgi:hypothetical protein